MQKSELEKSPHSPSVFGSLVGSQYLMLVAFPVLQEGQFRLRMAYPGDSAHGWPRELGCELGPRKTDIVLSALLMSYPESQPFVIYTFLQTVTFHSSVD